MWEDKRQAGLEEKRLMLSCAWTKTNKYSVIILQSIIKMTNRKPELGGGGRRGEKININQDIGQQWLCVCLFLYDL